jgi:hypothetical protein
VVGSPHGSHGDRLGSARGRGYPRLQLEGRPQIGGISESQRIENPPSPWNHRERCAQRRSPRVAQQARNLRLALGERGRRVRFLVRDRDARSTRAFDDIFRSDDAEVLAPYGLWVRGRMAHAADLFVSYALCRTFAAGTTNWRSRGPVTLRGAVALR